jgi:hypothetical protein
MGWGTGLGVGAFLMAQARNTLPPHATTARKQHTLPEHDNDT